MKYRIIETIVCGNSTFQVQYKKLKWWWFGWRHCYFEMEGNPKTYSSYARCLEIVALYGKDGIKVGYI